MDGWWCGGSWSSSYRKKRLERKGPELAETAGSVPLESGAPCTEGKLLQSKAIELIRMASGCSRAHRAFCQEEKIRRFVVEIRPFPIPTLLARAQKKIVLPPHPLQLDQ